MWFFPEIFIDDFIEKPYVEIIDGWILRFICIFYSSGNISEYRNYSRERSKNLLCEIFSLVLNENLPES